MTKIRISLIAIAVIFLSYGVSSAQDSYSEIDPGNVPENVEEPDNSIDNIEEENIVVNGLEFFEDEEQFGAFCGSLATEDFEDTNVGPEDVGACAGAFNSLTDNVCYSPGALISGFSMFATGPGDQLMAVLTPNFLGVTNVAVGANSFNNNTNITFDPPASAASMLIFSPTSGGAVDVDVFGPGNAFLGSATLNLPVSNVGTFLGIASPIPISQIVVDGDGQDIGELFYELSFGQCQDFTRDVPTLSEWGLIAMAGILGFVGFMVIRSRRVTA